MFRKKTKKGFTIVELVIVIAVIAILSAVLIPTFAGLIKKANISADQTLVRNLNTSLAISSEGGGTKNSTMYQTLEAMKEQGYVVDKLTPTHSKNNIVWDSENNQFVLVYENGETFTGTTVDPTVDKSKMWKVYTEIPTESEYSVYLAGTNVTGNVEVKGVGFDAGENVGISTVTYKNETNVAKDVVIRTNGGNLTVNSGSVVHYGVARYLTLDSSATYTEKGSIVANITDFEQKTEESGWTVVKTENELKDALERNVEKIMLGANITTVNDITDGTPDTFTVNSNVEINLNGYNITGVHTNNVDTLNKNNVLINVNNATLTLSGYGVISLKYEGTNMQWNALSATLRLSGSTGTINVNDAVVVDHLGGTAMSYAIDCYASGNANTLNVNGGALNSTYIAIRWFYPNADSTGKLNINAGIITGANRDIWTQGSTADNSAIVKIADSYKVKVNGDSYYLD